MTALAKIKDAGFTLSLTDSGNLKIAPFSKLTPEQRRAMSKQWQEYQRSLAAQPEISPSDPPAPQETQTAESPAPMPNVDTAKAIESTPVSAAQ